MSVYCKNNKGNTKHIAHLTRATAGNVLETLIPEFNTLEVPGGSVAYACKIRTNKSTAGVDEDLPLTY